MFWKILPDYPDYAANFKGDIYRINIIAGMPVATGSFLKPATTKSGYKQITLCREGKSKNYRVNRVICRAFHGEPPSAKHHAAHIDGDKANNCANNLRWATAAENEADKIRHETNGAGARHWTHKHPDRRAHGSGHGLAKLDEVAVRAIRHDPRTQREIASDYGVSQKTIHSIKHNKIWRHVL